MRFFSTRRGAILVALAASALLCSCSDKGPSGPGPDTDCIGSAGGSVASTDTSDLLYGVSLDVAPGDWSQCWSVSMFYRSTFSTPNFPDGIEGYEGWLTGGVELEIGHESGGQWVDAPDTLAFELTFPLRDLTAEPGWKIMAFRYDDAAGVYRLVPPARLDDKQLTVRARNHRQLWTWGKVDLLGVDFDTYLAPMMEEMAGTDAWLEIRDEMDRLQEEVLAGHRALTCEALQIVRGSLLAAGEAAADNVRQIQNSLNGRCGTCDATTSEFYDELSDYLKYSVGKYMSDFFLGNSRNVLLEIYGCIMSGYMQYCIDELGCDFDCFADAMHVDFYVQLGLYGACRVMVELIDWAMISGYISC